MNDEFRSAIITHHSTIGFSPFPLLPSVRCLLSLFLCLFVTIARSVKKTRRPPRPIGIAAARRLRTRPGSPQAKVRLRTSARMAIGAVRSFLLPGSVERHGGGPLGTMENPDPPEAGFNVPASFCGARVDVHLWQSRANGLTYASLESSEQKFHIRLLATRPSRVGKCCGDWGWGEVVFGQREIWCLAGMKR